MSRPPAKARLVWTALLGAGAVLAAIVIVTAVLAWQSTTTMRDEVQATRAAVMAGDLPAASAHLRAAESASFGVQRWTTGPQWWVAERLPGLGAQIASARAVAQAVKEVAPPAAALLDLAGNAQADGLTTADGAINLDLIEKAVPLSAELAEASRSASAVLAQDSAIAESAELSQVPSELDRMADLLDRGAEAAAFLPAFLGADGARSWAVLLQNTAEIRGSGGLIGAYALVTADKGRISLDEAVARKDGLDGESIPYEKVAEAGQVQTWGGDLSRWSDFNLSLDFPLTGELTAAGMAKRGTPVQGVVGIDARVVAALLAGTGPIEEGGVRLTQDNAESFFTRDIYAKVPDVEQKDALTVLLLQATLERALTGGIDVVAMLRALVDPVSQGRLRLWSSIPVEQEWLRTTPLAGALPDQPGPFVGIALNNSAGSKLDAYLGLGVHYRVGACEVDSESVSTLEISFLNDSPAGLPDYVDLRLDRPKAPSGSTSLLVHVYGPQNAALKRAVLEGRPESFTATQEGGHPVWGFDVELERGVPVTLRLRFTEPTVNDQRPMLLLPPLVERVRGKVTERKCS